MDVTKVMLVKIFDSTERLDAPLFQRPYVWNAFRNWQPLWEAIKTLAQKLVNGEVIRPHFLGTLVLEQLKTPPGRVHARQIIDGQQRLTTLQLALAAARDIAHKHGCVNHEQAFRALTENKAPLSTCEEDFFKVWPTNADRDDFRAVMTAGSRDAVGKLPHAELKDEWLIPNAYLWFWDKYAAWLEECDGPDFPSRLNALYNVFVDGLQVVVINLESKDDAQEIFETLNALGTPLLPADLVKNFLFHEAIEQGHSTQVLYDRHWREFDTEREYWRREVRQGRLKRPRLDLFLYHYLTLMHGEVILDTQLFDRFKAFFQKTHDHCAEKHMSLFRSYADTYRSFDRFPRNSREELFFYRLQQLDISTLHPLMLEICNRYAAPEDQEKRVRIMEDIESFLVRRLVCQLSTKNYNRFFTEFINRLRQTNDFSPSNVRDILASETAETSVWPTDAMFKTAWTEIAFYKRIRSTKTRMILEAIERSMYNEKSERVDFERSLTLEHLMPQESNPKHWPLPCDSKDEKAIEEAMNARRRVIHGIGNLTLLTQKLNSSISNGPWGEKVKEILRYTRMNLNHSLSAVDQWSEESIKDRAGKLFARALAIWPRPPAKGIDLQLVFNKPTKQSGDRKHLRMEYTRQSYGGYVQLGWRRDRQERFPFELHGGQIFIAG